MRNIIVLTLCAGLWVGCGYEDGGLGGSAGFTGSADPSEDVEQVTSALTQCSYSYTTYTASSENDTETGPSPSTHFCFLTDVRPSTPVDSGSSTAGHATFARVERNSGRWVIYGNGTMTCVNLCAFYHSSSSAVRWTSEDFIQGNSPQSGVSSCTDMWWGDSAGILQGAFMQTGSDVTTWATSADASSEPRQLCARAYDGFDGGVAYGNSLFVGIPNSNHQLRRWGTVNCGGATSNTSGTLPVRNDEGICYFKRLNELAGQIGSQADLDSRRFRIYRSSTDWKWESKGSVGVRPKSTVECIYFNQNR